MHARDAVGRVGRGWMGEGGMINREKGEKKGTRGRDERGGKERGRNSERGGERGGRESTTR